MKLWEAMKHLEEGEKVRRRIWDKSDYLYKEDDTLKRYQNRNFILDLESFSYEDWELYDDRKELPSQLDWLKEGLSFFNSNKVCIEHSCFNCVLNKRTQYGDTYCSNLEDTIREINNIYKLDK